jgi:hypothetical protein
MNNREKHSEDPLRNYINPEVFEKAPEGFTAKVMNVVQKEPVPVRKQALFSMRNLVPAVSASVVIMLILLTILFPGSKNDSILLPAMDALKKISISLPEFDISSFLNFDIPATLIYVLIGILILSLFDRALNIVFHREK